MKKSPEELIEVVEKRIEVRTNTIVESESTIQSKTVYAEQLKQSLDAAKSAYEEKVKNINRMIEVVEGGISKEKAKLSDREKNLNELLEVKLAFDAKYAELEAARFEEVEIKDDMSKGLEDFKYIEKKLERIKKELAQVATRAGSVFFGR